MTDRRVGSDQPEGNLFKDRFTSMQHRALVEPRKPVSFVPLPFPPSLRCIADGVLLRQREASHAQDQGVREARVEALRVIASSTSASIVVLSFSVLVLSFVYWRCVACFVYMPFFPLRLLSHTSISACIFHGFHSIWLATGYMSRKTRLPPSSGDHWKASLPDATLSLPSWTTEIEYLICPALLPAFSIASVKVLLIPCPLSVSSSRDGRRVLQLLLSPDEYSSDDDIEK